MCLQASTGLQIPRYRFLSGIRNREQGGTRIRIGRPGLYIAYFVSVPDWTRFVWEWNRAAEGRRCILLIAHASHGIVVNASGVHLLDLLCVDGYSPSCS